MLSVVKIKETDLSDLSEFLPCANEPSTCILSANVDNHFQINQINPFPSFFVELTLNVEFRGINETGSERVFNDFVGGVDAKFAEDVLAVGGYGVYA